MTGQHRGAQYLLWPVVLMALVVLTASWACDDPPPIIILSPGPGGILSGTVTIEATPNDDGSSTNANIGYPGNSYALGVASARQETASAAGVTISRVEFIAMGESIASFTTPPYICEWDTTSVKDGHCNVKAVAYDGDGRALFPPDRVRVVVCNAVRIGQPAKDAVVSGMATIAGTVKEGVKVSLIKVYVGGKKIGSATASPFSLQWDSTTVPDGQHFLRLKAYDGKRLVRQCRARFKVKNK